MSDIQETEHTMMNDDSSSDNKNDKESGTTPTSRHGMGSKKQSMLMGHSKDVPIVELKLENVSYEPLTSTAAAAKQKNAKNQSKNNNRTTVLSNITTTVSPYKLTAWMGPSGSGKTSLTSVVAGLVNPDDVRGVIKVNGDEGRLPKQYVGVVWQDDLLLSNLTVEETIYFAARLKTSVDTTDEEVQTLVEETMEELGLSHVRDNLIGSSIANIPGISGGERKRTSVAAELVVKPSLLLLDEPTSGLDATTASSLMMTLRDLSSNGHSIAVVIHQPRTDIFKMLDHLLLLSKGRVLYNGDACAARCHLEACPSVGELPPETGIADWIMDTVILDESKKGDAVLANYWASSSSASSSSSATQTIKQGALSSSCATARKKFTSLDESQFSTLTELQETPKKFEAPFRKQLQLLMSRTLKQRRGEKFTTVAILLTLCYTTFTSLFWWRLPDTTAFVFSRNSIIFFFLIAQGNSIVVASMTVFQRERALLSRERAKKMYGVFPYFIAKTTSDMTNNVLLPLCYGMICYYTAGLRPDIVSFLKFILGYYLTLSCAQSMGFFLSSLIPNLGMALVLAPPVTLFFFIMGGFYIPLADLHVGIKWASYLSFARYGYSALLVNEFAGRDIACAEDDVAISIGDSTECPVSGDSIYEGVGIEGIFANYWFNILMVALLNVFFLTGAYGLLRRSK